MLTKTFTDMVNKKLTKLYNLYLEHNVPDNHIVITNRFVDTMQIGEDLLRSWATDSANPKCFLASAGINWPLRMYIANDVYKELKGMS